MKKVLVLGTKNYDYDFFYEFKSIGYECFFCGNQKSSLIPDEQWIRIDFIDVANILKFMAHNPDFKYVIPGSNDLSYLSASEISEKCATQNSIIIDSKKIAENYILKTKFRSQKLYKKIFVPKLFSLKNFQNENKPFVLKQDKMSGGKGVSIFKNGKHFKKNTNKKEIKENFLVEEYIEGSGHGISYIVKEGKIIFEFYDDEYYCKDKLAVVATSTPSSLSSPHKKVIREFCLDYFKEFKLVDGFFHIQCIKKDEKIYIIECTRRLPGDYYHEFSSLSLGTSYLRSYIKSFIGYYEIFKSNRIIKNIVRVVLDDLIISQIKNSKEIKNLIKMNLIKKKKLDGFRFGENNKTYRKKGVIFLEFDNPHESIDFCKKLFLDL